jgi:hypothetical protein
MGPMWKPVTLPLSKRPLLNFTEAMFKPPFRARWSCAWVGKAKQAKSADKRSIPLIFFIRISLKKRPKVEYFSGLRFSSERKPMKKGQASLAPSPKKAMAG